MSNHPSPALMPKQKTLEPAPCPVPTKVKFSTFQAAERQIEKIAARADHTEVIPTYAYRCVCKFPDGSPVFHISSGSKSKGIV